MVNQLGMPNQRPTQMHIQMPNSMPNSMPNAMPPHMVKPGSSPVNTIPTSAPSSNLAAAAAAAALSARQHAYRNANPATTRIRRSVSTSSQLSNQLQSQMAQQWIQPKKSSSNGNTPTSLHFGPSIDLSSAIISPNSPTFQISQYPSPSTTSSEIDGLDDGANLMSPIVSPFLSNMPPVRFPTEAKRPNVDYSVDEVMSTDTADFKSPSITENPKRRRSNVHGHAADLGRRLSSASESGQLGSNVDFNSPSSSGSPPPPITSEYSSPAIGPVGGHRKPPTPTLSAASIHLNQRRSGGRYVSPVARSPMSGSFSPTSGTTLSREKTPTLQTTPSFGSQGQQIVFPLNSAQGIDDSRGSVEEKGQSPGKNWVRPGSTNGGMGRFEVLTFHQYENPPSTEDKRLKQKQKAVTSGESQSPSTVDSDGSLSRTTSSQTVNGSSKRISIVKEEEEGEDMQKENRNAKVSNDGGPLDMSIRDVPNEPTSVDVNKLQNGLDFLFTGDPTYSFEGGNNIMGSSIDGSLDFSSTLDYSFVDPGHAPDQFMLDDPTFDSGFLNDVADDPHSANAAK